MNKTLVRLRSMKSKAVDRMAELTQLAKSETRDLTAAEQKEFDNLKQEAESLAAEIEELERASAAAVAAPTNPTPKPAAAPPPAPQPSTALAAAPTAADEKARVLGIQKLVADAQKMCPAIKDSLATDLIGNDSTLDQARAKIFEIMQAEAGKEPQTRPNHSASVLSDTRMKYRENATAALLRRYDASLFPDIKDRGNDFMGMSLIEMARDYLTTAGVNTRGMDKSLIARVALQGNMGASEYFAGGMHSTSDFPNILLDAANKTLRRAYEIAPRTFTAFMRKATASDFKQVHRVQLSDAPVFQPVNEHGEYERVSVTDSKESYALATSGWIIAVTRRVVINDDLNALTRIPFLIGQAAANKESDTAWGIITANAAMSDNVALFHADHDNLNANNALDNDGLAAARTALRLQTGPKGSILNLVPKALIVPAALEQTALQLIFPTQLAAATPGGVVLEWVRNLIPVVEPRLDANSPTTWYMAADPNSIDTIEFCYLEGQEGVYTETQMGFDVDGLEIKARLDFAAAAIDYRGLSKNTA
jgi:hypothetical protein